MKYDLIGMINIDSNIQAAVFKCQGLGLEFFQHSLL